MQLNRETLIRLNGRELADVRGGEIAPVDDTGRWTSCIEPNCCGDTVGTQ